MSVCRHELGVLFPNPRQFSPWLRFIRSPTLHYLLTYQFFYCTMLYIAQSVLLHDVSLPVRVSSVISIIMINNQPYILHGTYHICRKSWDAI